MGPCSYPEHPQWPSSFPSLPDPWGFATSCTALTLSSGQSLPATDPWMVSGFSRAQRPFHTAQMFSPLPTSSHFIWNVQLPYLPVKSISSSRPIANVTFSLKFSRSLHYGSIFHLFIEQIFIVHQLCARCYSKHWAFNGEVSKTYEFLLAGSMLLMDSRIGTNTEEIFL